jgi:acetyltransferase-like isoleucine patch superfamily enzyme
MRVRVLVLRLLGVKILGKCWLQQIEIARNPWDIQIEAAALDNHVVLLTTGERRCGARIIIRGGVYINRFTMLDASEQIEIGENSMIGPYCYITDHDHGGEPGVPVSQQPLVSAPVRIGRDVWLGAGVTVLKGVTIGDGAIVGAGSVIKDDVLPGVKVAGVPGRLIGSRDRRAAVLAKETESNAM